MSDTISRSSTIGSMRAAHLLIEDCSPNDSVLYFSLHDVRFLYITSRSKLRDLVAIANKIERMTLANWDKAPLSVEEHNMFIEESQAEVGEYFNC